MGERTNTMLATSSGVVAATAAALAIVAAG
jgi:hypothetical protein